MTVNNFRGAARPGTAGVKEVAAAAGVSVGTVSNVLNRADRVSESTRLRVEDAMRRLGFVRNESARQLRAGHSNTVAYVMLDATNPFFTDVAQGIEQSVEQHDLSLFLCNSDNRADRELSYLRRLQQQRAQGVLITPIDPDSPHLAEIAQGMPLIIVDRVGRADTFCSVAVDDVLGGRLAVEHLLDLGHQRIAFVGGPLHIGQVGDRLNGARQAIAESGLEPDQLVTVELEALSVAEGRAAGQRIAGMGSSSRPTAAFCANDLVALGLLQQCVELGVGVPSDLGIVGYDDIDFAAAAAVPLTSVRQPRRELGRRASELLFDEVSNPDHRHEQVLFKPSLAARTSTRGGPSGQLS